MAAPTLYLINADTDQRLGLLMPGQVIVLGGPGINIEATGSKIGSVRFTLNGKVVRTENAPPFAMFGDNAADFAPWDVTPGSYTIRATAYSKDNAGGTNLGSVSRTLTVQAAPSPPPPPDGEEPPPPPPANRDGTSTVGDPWGLALMPPPPSLRVGFYTDFTEDGDRELGAGYGPYLKTGWGAREGMKDSSRRGTYSELHTFSQHNGIADIFLHSHMEGSNPLVHDPLGKIHKVFAALDKQGDKGESFIQWTQLCEDIDGRKQAPLYWAFGINDNGECDHYEHKYGAGLRSNSFFHPYMTQTSLGQKLEVDTLKPHTLGMYFRRRGYRGASDPGEFSTYVDGVKRKTWTEGQTPNPMHGVLQIETYLKSGNQKIPGWDSLFGAADGTGPGYNGVAVAGHIQFTKYRIDIP